MHALERVKKPRRAAPPPLSVATDIADGSGDRLLELPNDLMHALGWRIGDALEITRSSAGEIRIRKIVTA